MAQITHLEVAQQFNGRGRLVYKTACGELLLGHAGVRKNIDKVSCFRCKQNQFVRQAAKVELNIAAPVAVKNPRTKAEWKTYIKAHNCPKLGEGASRAAYDLGNGRVIKINVSDWDQCRSEVETWQKASDKIKPYLAAILDFGEGWVVMEKAKCTLEQFGGNDRIIRHDLRDATNIGDLHARNIGYFGNGQFKILDYAL